MTEKTIENLLITLRDLDCDEVVHDFSHYAKSWLVRAVHRLRRNFSEDNTRVRKYHGHQRSAVYKTEYRTHGDTLEEALQRMVDYITYEERTGDVYCQKTQHPGIPHFKTNKEQEEPT